MDEVFDLREALEQVDGDTEIFKEISAIFLESCTEQLCAIRAAVEDHDAHAMERAAHKLKGSLSILHAWPSQRAAHRMELMGREKDISKAAEGLAVLEKELSLLQERLREVLEEITP